MCSRGAAATVLLGHCWKSGRQLVQNCRVHRFASLVLCAVLAPAIAWPAAEAGNLAAGREKAKACRACHGLDGLSLRPDTPHIAGQIAFYLREQLRKYRQGTRAHEVMGVVAKQLSDADIEDLVAYYSSIKISVESLP